MSQRYSGIVSRAVFSLMATACLILVALTGWWALAPLPAHEHLATSVQAGSFEGGPASRESVATPVRVFAVTLRDAMVDAPKPSAVHAKPPAPPRLDLQLIAISGKGEARTLFAFEPASRAYLELRVGDTTPKGARLVSLDEMGASFRMAKREIRLDLAP